MSAQRIFYVTQESLSIWIFQGQSATRIANFSDHHEGHISFDAYMAAHAAVDSVMLVDVIEEEFVLETIPKLGFRDRKALIERRAIGRFRRTPYRTSDLQGKCDSGSGDTNVVISAISNHELVEPWVQTILNHRSPLSGIFSVPHLAPELFKRLFTNPNATMFVALHQGSKLRQVFLRGGHLRSARLSQLADAGPDAYAKLVVTETLRSRRYLERTRLLSARETLDICAIANRDTQEQIMTLSDASTLNRYFFIDPVTAAKKFRCAVLADESHFEELYLSAVLRRPKQNYATSGENRYWVMRRMRSALLATSVTIAALCSIASAIFLQDAWMLHDRVTNITAQVQQLSETFRREHESFDPIRADSYEMQQAVDSGDYILANRVPVPWVLNQLGQVMGDYQDVRLRELRWLAESPVAAEPVQQSRANAPLPVAIPAVSIVSAVLTAELTSFDGNMRSAFTRIDQLAADIVARTTFDQAFAVEYPFDASTSAAVSGEFDSSREVESAQFKLRVTYQVPGALPATQERADETI